MFDCRDCCDSYSEVITRYHVSDSNRLCAPRLPTAFTTQGELPKKSGSQDSRRYTSLGLPE